MNKQGFTFIELIVVIAIVLLLVVMTLPMVKKSIYHANKASCMSNIRTIIQAMHLYLEDYEGENIPATGYANDFYGFLYYTSEYKPGSIGGLTDSSVLVCPARKTEPAIFKGFGQPLTTNQTTANGFTNQINYSIIRPEDNSFPNYNNMPATNAVIWEAYFFNHGNGRHIGFWNQTVKFIPSEDPKDYPTNLNADTGLPESYDIFQLCGPGVPAGNRRVIDPDDNR